MVCSTPTASCPARRPEHGVELVTKGSDARAKTEGAVHYQTLKGMRDVTMPESARWEQTVVRFAQLVEAAGYGLAITPILENVGIFHRGIGEGSDIVGKEMYTFADRDGLEVALRPEGTASIVRAFVEHHPIPPWKAWYFAPSFRHENPQKGRYRQHFQLGVEALGPDDADLDVEVVSLAHDFIAGLGLHEVTLKLHSMGDGNCRPAYIDLLRDYLAQHEDQLCDSHGQRYRDNPLRVLDCKTAECRAATEQAPNFTDHLCDECGAHFTRVQAGLTALDVPFAIDHRLVRGFDYYTRTTFEFASGAIDAAQNALGGGGRYNGLVEMLGGPATPGIGFGLGMERLLIACDAEGIYPTDPTPLAAYVIDLTGGAEAVLLTAELRRAGLGADRAFDGRSMKSQIKSADRSGALVALVIGAQELESNTVGFRPLRTEGDQRAVPRCEVVAELHSLLANINAKGSDASS
jgi:histidyl-tRNA synthetase